MKAREYAASLGLAQAGKRGRMSKEAHEAIRAAIAEGKTFSDYSDKPVKVVKDGAVRPAAARSVSPMTDDTHVSSTEAHRAFPEGTKIVMTLGSGKKVKVSEREVCGTCRYSLSYHICNTPNVIAPDGSGHLPVVIG